MILFCVFSCGKKKQEEIENKITFDNDLVRNSVSNLPEEIDSINIFFEISGYKNFALHIDKANYILRDLNNTKSYDVSLLKDSLNQYVNDLFVSEKVQPIIQISKSNYIHSEKYSSTSVIKYLNNKPDVHYNIVFEDQNVDVEFSKEYISLKELLFFISYSPTDIERRLNVVRRFRENTKSR